MSAICLRFSFLAHFMFLSLLSTWRSFITGAVADRYRIHSQLSGSLTIACTFIQVMLLFIPSVIHQEAQNCEIKSGLSFSTPISENGTLFPVDVSINATNASSTCFLHYRHSNFSFTCDTSQPNLATIHPRMTLNHNRTNTLDVRWNCSVMLNKTNSAQQHDMSLCAKTEISLTKNLTFPNSCGSHDNPAQNVIIFNRCENSSMHLSCQQLGNDTSIREIVHQKYGLTFWVYFGIHGFGIFIMNPIWPLLHSIAYSLLGNQRNSWGKQRLWGKSFSL